MAWMIIQLQMMSVEAPCHRENTNTQRGHGKTCSQEGGGSVTIKFRYNAINRHGHPVLENMWNLTTNINHFNGWLKSCMYKPNR